MEQSRPVAPGSQNSMCSLAVKDSIQQANCFHFSNYQPLWVGDNLAKGAKKEWLLAAESAYPNYNIEYDSGNNENSSTVPNLSTVSKTANNPGVICISDSGSDSELQNGTGQPRITKKLTQTDIGKFGKTLA
ncbi:hypothetical protein WJX77_011589 [Trebouxia sp. C0004]